MKHVQDDSGPKQRISFGIGGPEQTIDATPRQMFLLLQQAWNMRECVRLLTPGVSEQQFSIDDQRWIKESNDALDQMFKKVGLKLQRARELFAPNNCPDLIVPHVVFNTVPLSDEQPVSESTATADLAVKIRQLVMDNWLRISGLVSDLRPENDWLIAFFGQLRELVMTPNSPTTPPARQCPKCGELTFKRMGKGFDTLHDRVCTNPKCNWRQIKAPVHKEREDIFDDYEGQDHPTKR